MMMNKCKCSAANAASAVPATHSQPKMFMLYIIIAAVVVTIHSTPCLAFTVPDIGNTLLRPAGLLRLQHNRHAAHRRAYWLPFPAASVHLHATSGEDNSGIKNENGGVNDGDPSRRAVQVTSSSSSTENAVEASKMTAATVDYFYDQSDDNSEKNLNAYKNQGFLSKPSQNEETLGDESAATVRNEDDVGRARLLLLASAALYGTNFSLVKILGDSMPVGVSSTLRFALATLATLPWLLPSDKDDASFSDTLKVAWLGFEVGAWNSIGYIAQAIGLETTDASKSAFICSLAVVTVPLLEFATGKTLKGREWAGALLAVLGVGMLELGGVDLQSGQPLLSRGDLLSFVQPIAFGIGFWRVERVMAEFPTQANRATAAQLLAVFLASAGYMFLSTDVGTLQTYPWQDWLTDPSILFSLFWTGVITTALTILMETRALRTLTAAETTLIFSTEPLFGTAFAAAVMGEQLGAGAALGSVLILAGCLYSNLGVEGIRSIWTSTGLPQKVARTRFGAYISKAPQRARTEWLWFWCSIAAYMISFSVLLEEELPELEDFASTLFDALRALFYSIR
eukprot:CAMPEP_0119547542 /NCGR_PEP_ID=MMETSP1352-20130426/1638_1 /TAXON_ID=265584 /ORGANISM="Stauroneis constricta, Strain CCMP1120" /LENGTH=567 /DNA_ID=CAMNT_0007592489 /DNA_START=164 /DNA_END=1867 /DNA_ORIENTATION=-